MIGAAVLFCYLLAYHLTDPLRELEKAVARFGQGDFSARARSTRGDELGQLARTFDHMAERIETLLAAERRLLRRYLARTALAAGAPRRRGRTGPLRATIGMPRSTASRRNRTA